jgi:hypothetical protein
MGEVGGSKPKKKLTLPSSTLGRPIGMVRSWRSDGDTVRSRIVENLK